MQIQTKIIENKIYYIMESKGIRYTLTKAALCYDGEWELHSLRISLGRMNVGSYRWFNSLKEIEKLLKAFRGISAVIN